MIILRGATVLLFVIFLFAGATVGFRTMKGFVLISIHQSGERPSRSVPRPAEHRRLCVGTTTASEPAERGHLCPIS